MAKLPQCCVTFIVLDGKNEARPPVSFKASRRNEVMKSAARAIGAAGSTPTELAKHNVLHIYFDGKCVYDAKAKVEPEHVAQRHRRRRGWHGERPLAVLTAAATAIAV